MSTKQVPKEATCEMVGGAARQIIMWIGFADSDGASLAGHLRKSGVWQEWMTEYVPNSSAHMTKGALASLLWRYMYEAAPEQSETKKEETQPAPLTYEELVRLVRDVAVAVEKTGPGGIAAAVMPLRRAGILPEEGVGRTDIAKGSVDEVRWFAGAILGVVDSKAWFAVNSWINCVDVHAPASAITE